MLEMKTTKSEKGAGETAQEKWLWHQVNTQQNEDEKASGIGVKAEVPKANYVMQGLSEQK